MNHPHLEIKGVSKKYRLGGTTLKERLGSLFSRHHQKEEVWALQDVDLTLNPSEITLIRGANGSGKSTLLKVIAGVTEPTRGRLKVKGRIGALLEVGTGMHPELTGLDNITFCAALLGVKRSYALSKLKAIVEFAEIAPFLHTPLKKYSSGMALRLASSVLFHVGTDIILIDEILAMADPPFQKKCLEKLEELAKRGAIIAIVSHQEETLLPVVHRIVTLDKGRVL